MNGLTYPSATLEVVLPGLRKAMQVRTVHKTMSPMRLNTDLAVGTRTYVASKLVIFEDPGKLTQ